MFRTVAALLLTALLGVAMMGGAHPAVRVGQMDLAGAQGSKSKMTVKAGAKGLLPGITKRLIVKVTNPWRFRIKVIKVSIVVADASKKCKAGNLKVQRQEVI